MSSSCPLEGRILNFRMARLSEIISSNMVPVSPFAIEFAAARLTEIAGIEGGGGDGGDYSAGRFRELDSARSSFDAPPQIESGQAYDNDACFTLGPHQLR